MLLAQPARDFAKFGNGPAHAGQTGAGLEHGIRRAKRDSLLRQFACDGRCGVWLRKNLGARNGAPRQAGEIKLRDAMLDGVHRWRSVKFLRVRYRNVVKERILVSRPADTERRA